MCAEPAKRKRTSKAVNRVTLQRALSKLGYCSRSQAEALILSGNILVNEKICTKPGKWIDLAEDLITVEGKQLAQKKFCYILFHKPSGIVTTRADERGRKTIYDVLEPSMRHLKPVGRLDMETSGMLLLTNDHQWAEHMTHPESHVRKIYDVQLEKPLSFQDEESLRDGISIRLDGNDYFTLPAVPVRREYPELSNRIDGRKKSSGAKDVRSSRIVSHIVKASSDRQLGIRDSSVRPLAEIIGKRNCNDEAHRKSINRCRNFEVKLLKCMYSAAMRMFRNICCCSGHRKILCIPECGRL